jgi:cytochrome c peroxidase
MAKKEGRLLFFTGKECVHCHESEPIVARFEKEHKTKLVKLEVWHDSENAAILEKLDNGKCGGVPFFYNEKNGKWICGTPEYEELVDWAK